MSRIEADPSHAGGKCKIAILLDGLSKTQATELRELLATPKEQIPHTKLTRALNAEYGEKFGKTSADGVQRHRQGSCSCR